MLKRCLHTCIKAHEPLVFSFLVFVYNFLFYRPAFYATELRRRNQKRSYVLDVGLARLHAAVMSSFRMVVQFPGWLRWIVTKDFSFLPGCRLGAIGGR